MSAGSDEKPRVWSFISIEDAAEHGIVVALPPECWIGQRRAGDATQLVPPANGALDGHAVP